MPRTGVASQQLLRVKTGEKTAEWEDEESEIQEESNVGGFKT
jgi:hypothetical protein